MKICLVHEEYPEETNFGGIATYQKRLAEEYVRQGHTVYVIARGLTCDKEYIENGVNIHRIFVNKTNDQVNDYITYRKKVANILLSLQSKNEIDIIEVPDWGAETVFFENLRKVPLVVRLHTPLKVWLKYNKNNFGKVANLLLEWEDYMLKHADLITCCSKILKTIITGEFNIPAKKIFVTPNPADLNRFFKNNKIKKENRIVYVGSLEERKGVIVLAKALNIFFNNNNDVKVDFIGKDTTRNNLNISTVKYIKQIINKKYWKNLNFLGQLNNDELNYYYNRSRVAVFPSLFDNFPYVVLEAMATGVWIVGSKNSGMVEMLADDSVYDTPSHDSLALLLEKKYSYSLKEQSNNYYISRVKRLYNAERICKNMIKYYAKTISDYKNYYVSQNTLQQVLKNANIDDEIVYVERLKKGVSNSVFKVRTTYETYIIKKYNSNIPFKNLNLLYNLYKQENNIKCVKPINKNYIIVDGLKFNIFPFVKGKYLTNATQLFPVIILNRKTTLKNEILDKCERFNNGLISCNNPEIADKIAFVKKCYEELRNNIVLKEQYLNHGDLSKTNIIKNGNKLFVIDFDEVTVGPMLYDFAVVCIKFLLNKNVFNFDEYSILKDMIIKNTSYSKNDCDVVLKFYLCKILLEKFYLHNIGKINIFSVEQKRDDFNKYYNLLKHL